MNIAREQVHDLAELREVELVANVVHQVRQCRVRQRPQHFVARPPFPHQHLFFQQFFDIRVKALPEIGGEDVPGRHQQFFSGGDGVPRAVLQEVNLKNGTFWHVDESVVEIYVREEL